jgi:TFIIF-interacting CTD phosphatase-like protein
MLDSLKPKYELILFTAGSREYMEQISFLLKNREGQDYFDYLLCKDYMRRLHDNSHEKDLSVLLKNRSLNNMLIIDNNETKIRTHAQNVIPIIDYYGDKSPNDNQLY